jgi:hypothetical protein
MSNCDSISIELTMAERHTLNDLLTDYIRERVFEAVKFARTSIDFEEAAKRTKRLALLQGLAEDDGSLPVDDLDAIRDDLILSAMETEETVDEHDAIIAEMHTRPGTEQDHRESIAELRRNSAVDYAHKTVCERIVKQIDAAREQVA